MVPGGLPPPLRVSTAVDPQQGMAPPWTQCQHLQAGLRRHLSPDLRSQLFLFLPSLTACSRRWDPGSPPESVWTVWLQLGLMSLFSQSPPEMQFTSLLSVVKLLVLFFFLEILFYFIFFFHLLRFYLIFSHTVSLSSGQRYVNIVLDL